MDGESKNRKILVHIQFMKVPAIWEMNGYGNSIYVNVCIDKVWNYIEINYGTTICDCNIVIGNECWFECTIFQSDREQFFSGRDWRPGNHVV